LSDDFFLFFSFSFFSGHYVPELAKMIVERNPIWMRINLKGFMVGNPDIDDTWDSMGTIDYYYSHAMISSETYNGLKENCHFDDPHCCSSLCNAFFTTASLEIGNIDYYSVTTDVCTAPTSTAGNRRRLQTLGSHTPTWNPVSCLLTHTTSSHFRCVFFACFPYSDGHLRYMSVNRFSFMFSNVYGSIECTKPNLCCISKSMMKRQQKWD
jgi:hypothetical protein